MKFIFLDIDGVLNSTDSVLAKFEEPARTQKQLEGIEKLKTYFPNGELPYEIQDSIDSVDSVAVGLMNRLERKSGAKYVLISSHRAYLSDRYEKGDWPAFGIGYHIQRLMYYLNALGLDGFRLEDVTPELRIKRGHEVAFWIKERNSFQDPILDCGKHVIIDDGKDFLPNQAFVHIDAARGFTADDYYKACQFLGVEESSIIY